MGARFTWLNTDHFGRTPANSQEIHEETSDDWDKQSDFPLEEECEVVIGGRVRSSLSSVDQDSAECSSDVEQG
ncbi:hypothetical protein DPMN_066377 [Dreissena polymorpha]|uniref:Uncharacterized protein n=1 Tax=Dreissena polymorpha TaxID=45954 RepID=A0A9D3YXP6_DREPO|nr:hypothetical protein DPMN_066377 [Dreissena polymorpha]